MLLGCGLEAPVRGRLLAAEADQEPVALAVFKRRVRHTDVMSVEVVFPANEDGTPRRPSLALRWPGVVLVHGGLVSTERYHWLAAGLARRGYVVALPRHALDLPILEGDNASVARDLLAFPPEGSLLDGFVNRDRLAVAGHSLGGVVAVKSLLTGGYGAAALMASYPDAADAERLRRTNFPTLLLAGAADCEATVEDITNASREAVPRRNVLAVIEGATHYQFTDSDAEDVARECPPAVALEVTHARILEVLEVFLREALDDSAGTGELALRQRDWLEVSRLESGE